MSSSIGSAALFLGLTLALAATEASYAQSYVAVDLGTLGGNASGSDGLNNLGRTVGWAKTPAGAYYGFISAPGGAPLTNLGPPPNGTYSYAQAANTAGQVVGHATVSVGFGEYDHAFLWQDGVMTDLGTLGGDRSRAWAINGAGQIVGWAQDAGGGYHAFVWEAGPPPGMMRLPGIPGGYPDSDARDINEAGVAVGHAWDASFPNSIRRPVVWESGALEPRNLDLPSGATGATAFAINNENEIVGNSWGPGGVTHAVQWAWNGEATVLPPTRSHTYNNAYGINDAGQVVGESFSGGHLAANRHAPRDVEPNVGSSGGPVLWEHGIAFELDDIVAPAPGTSLYTVADINESGQIAATGNASGGFRALRLDPIPNGLGLTGPDPGYADQVSRVAVRGATPGQRTYFVYGLTIGSTPVPACPKVTIPVGNAVLIGSSVADENGHAVFSRRVPPEASGHTVYFGAVELPSCRVANRTVRHIS